MSPAFVGRRHPGDNRRVGSRTTILPAAVALLFSAAPPAQAQDLADFSSRGLPRSDGFIVRLQHPAAWKEVEPDDALALAELRGPQGSLTGILQVARGQQRGDMSAVCHPQRAQTMLRDLTSREPGTRVTDVLARMHQGRQAFEIRYERRTDPGFLRVRSLILCLRDSRLVVSCGGAGEAKAALGAIEPVCDRVLRSVDVVED